MSGTTCITIDSDNHFECGICNLILSSSDTLNQHLLIHTEEGPFQTLNESETQPDKFEDKTDNKEKPIKKAVCTKYDKTFSGKVHAHVKRHMHLNNRKSCKYEEKLTETLNTSQVSGHSIMHRGESCNVTSTVTPLHELQKLRKRRVHINHSSRCIICNKTFRNKIKFIKHNLAHAFGKPKTEQPVLPCTICNVIFNRKEYLHRHIALFHSNRHYACSLCNKSFIEKGDLEKHQHVHAGERPYECYVCKKTFVELENITRHMLVHSRENASRISGTCTKM